MPAYDPSQCAQSFQSCRTLCNPVDCSPPGSSVHGILQARILEGVAISFSRRSSHPMGQTCISHISCIAGRFFTNWVTVPSQKQILSQFLNHQCFSLLEKLIQIEPYRMYYFCKSSFIQCSLWHSSTNYVHYQFIPFCCWVVSHTLTVMSLLILTYS